MLFGRLEAGGQLVRSAEMRKWARELRHSKEFASASEMSTRAETFDTNRQKWARELRHSKEFASAAEMSTRAETFDTNRQKGARELRHSKEFARGRIGLASELDRVGYTWERFVSNGLARVLILVVLRGIELGGRPGEGVRYYIGLRIRVMMGRTWLIPTRPTLTIKLYPPILSQAAQQAPIL